MISHRLKIASTLLLLIAQSAAASYLRLIPSCQVRIDVRSKKVTFDWSVKNDGDEPAESVSVELPVLNQASILASELRPQGTASQTLTFPFAKLGIDNPGVYSLVYRVTYKDGNLFPFSAPHLAQIILPPSIGRVLMMQIDRPGSELRLTQEGKKRISFKLRNVLDKPILLEKVEALTPLELAMRLKDFPVPSPMQAGEERTIKATLQSSQTLLGSVYLMGLVISGTVEGTHFSEPMTFVVKIQETWWSPMNILLGSILCLSAVLTLAHFARKILKKRAFVSNA